MIDATLDLISFIIATGTIDKIALKLEHIRTCIDEDNAICSFIINSASLISVINQLLNCSYLSNSGSSASSKSKAASNQSTTPNSNLDLVKSHFIQSCEQTDFVSLVPALYTFLVLSGTSEPRPTIFDGSKYGDQDNNSQSSIDNLAIFDSNRNENGRLSLDDGPNFKATIFKKNAIPTTRLPVKLARVTYVCLEALNKCFTLNMQLKNMPSPIHMTIHLFRHIFNYLLWHLTSNDEINNLTCHEGVVQKFSPLEDDILIELRRIRRVNLRWLDFSIFLPLNWMLFYFLFFTQINRLFHHQQPLSPEIFIFWSPTHCVRAIM